MSRACCMTAALLMCAAFSLAEILRVPGEYATIGEAFDMVSEQDTVLVALGDYWEGVWAPPYTFWLIGDVPPDTGYYPRPLIDVSMSPDSLNRPCLTASAGSDLTVERFHFRTRNLSDSLPDVSGILVQAEHIRVVDCYFDSTRIPIQQHDWQIGVIELERCIFQNNVGIYALSAFGAIVANECRFQGDRSFYHVEASTGTTITNCVFTDNLDHSFLNLNGSDILVRGCTFGPGVARAFHAMYLSNFSGVFENNVVMDLQYGPSIVDVDVDTAATECRISGNTFVNLQRRQPAVLSPPVSIKPVADFPPPPRYEVSHNVFLSCSTTTGAKAIFFEGNGTIADNRFFDSRPSEPADVVGNEADEAVVVGNLFDGRGWGADTWPGWNGTLDARWNWWGDSTGPYEPTLNPEGGGDTVGSQVDFIPWLLDSNMTAAPEPQPALPSEFRLVVYPNPFNPDTRLKFKVAVPGSYRLTLYDLTGRKVKDIFEGDVVIEREITVHGADLPSGVYFARASEAVTRRPVATAKLVLVK